MTRISAPPVPENIIRAGPEEAKVSMAYRDAPRIFLSSKCSQMNAGEPQEIRTFVLSAPKCAEVNLHWRLLGDGAFNKVPAPHRNRQAHRITLPAQPEGAADYCLEAMLDDGQKAYWPTTAPAINQTTVVW